MLNKCNHIFTGVSRTKQSCNRRSKGNCNPRTKKEALQELSGIKINKQKVEHIKVQTRKGKELTTDVHKRMYLQLLFPSK